MEFVTGAPGGSGLWPRTTTPAAVVVAHAGTLVNDAVRALAQADQVEWVSDAATRYRVLLSEVQQSLVRTSALADAAHSALVAHDAAAAQTCLDGRSTTALALLGGSR